jgi:HlyD family secretion protein
LLYFLIFYLIKKILFENGKIISRLLAVRYKIFNQVFSGIKEIIFLKRQDLFFNKNKILQEVMTKKIILNNILTVAPKNIIEIISYISIVIIFFLITNIYNQDYSMIIPALAVIGFVAIKMIPAIQQIFSNLAYVGGSSNSFYQIFYDLKKHYKNIKSASNNKLSIKKDCKDFHFKKTICLDNISFKYPNREFEAIKKINIKINKNNRIGIIGPSGSGKSTIINIIMGLIYPTNGDLVVDNLLINKKRITHLQNLIGYVPQNFFLFDGTIVENVTLESNTKNIDFKKFNTAIKLSKLKDFLKELPVGIHSKIGEGGVLLSGGQRQRLAIARSLYLDKEILIFDEATSSLDVFAEDFIKKTLKKFMNNKTIIIVSHRIELIKECDVIYCINNGSVVDHGSFKYLKNKKYMKSFLNLN